MPAVSEAWRWPSPLVSRNTQPATCPVAGVCVAVWVGVGVCVAVWVGVDVCVGVRVGVDVCVGVCVAVGVPVGVAVGVSVEAAGTLKSTCQRSPW